MAPKIRRSLRSVKAALEEECTLEHTSKNIPVAPDTPLIGFSSPGPSTQALIDDILESNPFPLPELDFLDSQFDSTPSVDTRGYLPRRLKKKILDKKKLLRSPLKPNRFKKREKKARNQNSALSNSVRYVL